MRFTIMFRKFCGILVLLMLIAVSLGCQKQPQPVTPGAEAFRKDLLAEAELLTQLLAGPMAAGKGEETSKLIAVMEQKRPLKMGVGIMDANGVLVGGNRNAPSRSSNNYLSTNAVATALRGKPATMLLYYQDGSRDFVVCLPLRKDGKLVGVLGMYLPEAEARTGYGLTEQEFLALTFTP